MLKRPALLPLLLLLLLLHAGLLVLLQPVHGFPPLWHVWPGSTSRRLIQLSTVDQAQWLAQSQVHSLLAQGTKFMDITDHPHLGSQGTYSASGLPTKMTMQDRVRDIFGVLSSDYVVETLTQFTGFYHRYYNSFFGARASKWLFGVVDELARTSTMSDVVNVSTFSHKWPQNSIVARIKGSIVPEEVVIIGAHLDSINKKHPWYRVVAACRLVH